MIVNGDALLQGSYLEPVYRRISDELLQLSLQGWRARRDIDNLVHWYPRSLNTVADHFVNVAMDTKQEWAWVDKHACSPKSCFKMCVDGGLRGKPGEEHRPAGLGCAIYRMDPLSDKMFVPVCLAAQPVEGITSAFQAETLALDWSLTLFSSLWK